MKYKHILYPTDGSKESLKALQHVKQIAKAFETEVTVLAAYMIPYSVNNNFNSLPVEIYNQYKENNHDQAKKMVQEILHDLHGYGITAKPLVIEGNAKTVIVEYAGKIGCDLVIMGTRGHSQLNYMGSTSTYVMNNLPNCPVMVIS